MKPFVVRNCRGISGTVRLPGDKSISHRAIIISSLSRPSTAVRNFALNDDCCTTIEVFKKLGVKIIKSKDSVTVYGKGLFGLKKPKENIFINESGTTFRLLLGVLAGQSFKVKLRAGISLSRRPMSRVTVTLRLMGAEIYARTLKRNNAITQPEEYPPVIIHGNPCLKGIRYKMPVASAQVKSAILFAGLYTKGLTEIIEPVRSRDHTERMLKMFGAAITVKNRHITLRGGRQLVSPKVILVPADISSAAFFMVAACLVGGSRLILKDISLNPLRIGIITVLRRMGANIKVTKSPLDFAGGKPGYQASGSEPFGDITVGTSVLKAVTLKKEEIPSLIDELPILMVAACCARGRSVFRGIRELRVKETDRVNSMVVNLNKMGARLSVKREGDADESIVIEGPSVLSGTRVKSFGDHRTAMSLVVAGLVAQGKTKIDDVSCIAKSFPDFLKVLRSLQR